MNGGGSEDEADYSKGEGKLGWRVELAARWKALGVTFEPFGKDHTSRGGSTDTADRMAREVFDYPVPGRYEYEWISIKGRGCYEFPRKASCSCRRTCSASCRPTLSER